MNQTISIGSIIISLLFTYLAQSQEITNPKLNEALLNGESEFYHELAMNINYPRDARNNGVIGLSISNFKVNCDGQISHLNFQTTLGFGIEQEIIEKLQTLTFNWKPCEQRNENEIFSLKIAFGINGLYDPIKTDILVNAMVGDTYVISDQKLQKTLNKAIKKNDFEKAQEILKILLLRYPFDEEYLNVQQQLNNK